MAGRGWRLSSSTGRWEAIDLLKIVASQLIVWHHVSAYGPVADALHTSWPSLLAWLYDHGRMAVQVFLVLGGYLALPGLLAHMQNAAHSPIDAIVARYRRLFPPFAIAMVIAMVASAIARPWLEAELVGSPPQALQLIAHALLLQDVLGVESLSAGIWYVAMDLQLYAMLALLIWLSRATGMTTWPLAVPLLFITASLLWWNRLPQLDIWAPYFIGSYGLGMMARMARDATDWRDRARWLSGATALVILALWVEWRTRMAIALVVAWWLATAPAGLTTHWPLPLRSGIASLGQASYALFLLHFPVLLVCNTAWVAWGLGGPFQAWAMALGIACTSTGLALVFERQIERRLAVRRHRAV